MLRIDLRLWALAPGQSITFNIAWSYLINDQKVLRGLSGYEYFEDDKNAIFQVAQWFPRMAAHHDAVGWQNKQSFSARANSRVLIGDYELVSRWCRATMWWPPPAVELQNPQRGIVRRAARAAGGCES